MIRDAVKLCECGCGQPTALADRTDRRKGWVKGQPKPRVGVAHNGPRKRTRWQAEDRGYDTPCWTWQLSLDTRGYGAAWEPGGHRIAHRLVYEEVVGQIPAGMQLHHLCGHRDCVNPDHVEALTAREHRRRHHKTHCKRGHLLAGANLKAGRACRECARQRNVEYRERQGVAA